MVAAAATLHCIKPQMRTTCVSITIILSLLCCTWAHTELSLSVVLLWHNYAWVLWVSAFTPVNKRCSNGGGTRRAIVEATTDVAICQVRISSINRQQASSARHGWARRITLTAVFSTGALHSTICACLLPPVHAYWTSDKLNALVAAEQLLPTTLAICQMLYVRTIHV